MHISNDFISSCYKRMKYIFLQLLHKRKQVAKQLSITPLKILCIFLHYLPKDMCVCVCVRVWERERWKEEWWRRSRRKALGLRGCTELPEAKIGPYLNVSSKLHIQARSTSFYMAPISPSYHFSSPTFESIHRQFPRKTRT